MSHIRIHDSGPEFEARALELVRAIHDPAGMQGAVILDERERDGVFTDDTSVTVYEFTTSNKKEKSLQDAEKTAALLARMSTSSEFSLKAMQGILVTVAEPTADQRQAVAGVAKRSGQQLRICSYATLKKRLIDAENYIELRRIAPFGSAPSAEPSRKSPKYVEPTLVDRRTQGESRLAELLTATREGARSVVLADYGTGKSELLRQSFERLRKAYFKDSSTHRIPVHINIRDCFGLRTPAEILRRHGEDLGFSSPNRLISAWRAGLVTLLLDGFDELIPSRWAGSATNLSNVRWQALSPVRQLISESPEESGIIVAGRPQYFSNERELLDVLGIGAEAATVDLLDFTLEQAREYLGDDDLNLPEWAPRRPLLIKFLWDAGYLGASSGSHPGYEGNAWYDLLLAIARREAERIEELNPRAVQDLLGRVAYYARSGEGPAGPIRMEDMRIAFRDTCGYEADEQGNQLLLRLPGLASTNEEISDARRFVDTSLANAAFAHDLTRYVSNPFATHPLASSANWTQASEPLVAKVAAVGLRAEEHPPGILNAAVSQRLGARDFDPILFDLVQVSYEMGLDALQDPPFLSGVLIPTMDLSMNVLSDCTFSSCIVEEVIVTDVVEGDDLPTLQDCLVGSVTGWAEMPPWAKPNFGETEIGSFVTAKQTVDGLGDLGLSSQDYLAYVVLRKVYAQGGRGRRFSALPRGLPLALRSEVSGVVNQLRSQGFLVRQSGKNEELVLPVAEKRKEVLELLGNPRGGIFD